MTDFPLNLPNLPSVVRLDIKPIQEDHCGCMSGFCDDSEPCPLSFQRIEVLFSDGTSIWFNHFIDHMADDEPVFMSQPLLPHSVNCTVFKPTQGLQDHANEIYQKEIGND